MMAAPPLCFDKFQLKVALSDPIKKQVADQLYLFICTTYMQPNKMKATAKLKLSQSLAMLVSSTRLDFSSHFIALHSSKIQN